MKRKKRQLGIYFFIDSEILLIVQIVITVVSLGIILACAINIY